MHRFKSIVTYGDYEFHTINRADLIETGQSVILKIYKKKFYSWEQIMNVKQIQVLRVLNNPNILKLKEIIKNRDELVCVYENYSDNLFEWYQAIRDAGQTVSESLLKSIIFQIASGVSYMHQIGYFHRDLSLEGVLISQNQNIQIGNFSCSREIKSRPPLTDYITTRWYRAPEQLIHSLSYTSKIDSWALGCIMAELYMLGPIFGGVSEIDQLFRILKILGTPNHNEWPEFFLFLENIMKDKPQELKDIQQLKPQGLYSLIPNASQDGIDLLSQLLTMNPLQRISMSSVLKHNFFNNNNNNNTSSIHNILLSEHLNEEQDKNDDLNYNYKSGQQSEREQKTIQLQLPAKPSVQEKEKEKEKDNLSESEISAKKEQIKIQGINNSKSSIQVVIEEVIPRNEPSFTFDSEQKEDKTGSNALSNVNDQLEKSQGGSQVKEETGDQDSAIFLKDKKSAEQNGAELPNEANLVLIPSEKLQKEEVSKSAAATVPPQSQKQQEIEGQSIKSPLKRDIDKNSSSQQNQKQPVVRQSFKNQDPQKDVQNEEESPETIQARSPINTGPILGVPVMSLGFGQKGGFNQQPSLNM